jgi:hypothetical protein
MNIIINGFHDKCFLPLLKNIFNNNFLENIFFIGTKDHLLLEKDNIRVFNFGECNFAIYPDTYDPEPLDQIIISKFSDCESLCMKMFDRLEFWVELSSEERKNLYLKHLKFWYSLINRFNITTYISSNIPHEIYDFIIYSIIKKRSGNVLCFTQGEYLNRAFLFINDVHDTSFFSKKLAYNEINNEVIDYYNNKKLFNGGYKKPFYMNDILIRGKIRKPLRFTKRYNQFANDPNYDQKYIFFPLHYQPELTTSPMAKEYVKQELIIQLLDYYLPKDIGIFIKEHPKQTEVGRNEIENKSTLYKKIFRRTVKLILKAFLGRIKISDVKKDIVSYVSSLFFNYLLSVYNIQTKNARIKFIKTTADSQELISNSLAVVTCTGTATIEALIKEKPVLIFGNFIYDYAPGVKKIISRQDMESAYDFVSNFLFNENELLNYLQMLYDNSYRVVVDTYYLNELNISIDDNNDKIYNIIEKYISSIIEENI